MLGHIELQLPFLRRIEVQLDIYKRVKSRPDYGLGSQVKVLEPFHTFEVVPTPLKVFPIR